MAEPTAAQKDFLDQMTRKLLVDWCAESLMADFGLAAVSVSYMPYLEYAISKKWVSKDPVVKGENREVKILSVGWDTASRFLKR